MPDLNGLEVQLQLAERDAQIAAQPVSRIHDLWPGRPLRIQVDLQPRRQHR
jgi:hypothetical protein